MLKKLDWYIIKKFLTTFFFTVLIITMVSVIIDFSDKVEDFIEEPVTLKEVVVDYYMNWILWINGLLFPLCVLIAVVFFTSRMAYNSEIISILNAGVSFRRLMIPYLVAGGFLMFLHFAGNHIVIPQANETHYAFQHTYLFPHSEKGKSSDIHIFVEPNTKVYIERYNKKQTSATNFRIEKIEKNQLVYLFKAKKAKWKEPPNVWTFEGFEIRTFDGKNETIHLGEKGEKMDTTVNLTPEDFIYYSEDKEKMPTPRLLEFIDLQRRRGAGNIKKYETELHRRTAEPFTILILTIIGLAVAARKVRGGMGLHLAIGVGIGAIYIFLSKFSITFATNESLPAIIGVWIPNIVFSFIAAYLVLNAQK